MISISLRHGYQPWGDIKSEENYRVSQCISVQHRTIQCSISLCNVTQCYSELKFLTLFSDYLVWSLEVYLFVDVMMCMTLQLLYALRVCILFVVIWFRVLWFDFIFYMMYHYSLMLTLTSIHKFRQTSFSSYYYLPIYVSRRVTELYM